MSKVSFEMWKERVEINTNNNFKLINVFYKKRKDGKNEAYLIIQHSCNHTFERRGGQWLKTQNCPKCTSFMKVSSVHAVLCLLFEKTHTGVEFEKDIGFKGYNGGHSKYDLFVPNYNGQDTVFEFQSRFHDDKYEFDFKKKEYAINNGYNYISLDHREDNILNIIKRYFPDILEILGWVGKELSRFNKANVSDAQILLDENLTVKEISLRLGISEHIINHAIKNGTLISSLDRKKVIYKIKPVVQLDKDGNFICEYGSQHKVFVTTGYKINSTLKNTSNYCGGYIWLYKDDYEQNNYCLPDKKMRHNDKVIQLDLNYCIINTFNSPLEASKILNIDHSGICRVLNKQRKKCGGFIFVYLSDLNDNTFINKK